MQKLRRNSDGFQAGFVLFWRKICKVDVHQSVCCDLIRGSLKRFIKKHKRCQHNQKSEIEQGEHTDIVARLFRIMLGVLTERYQTGERRNKRTDAADVHADKKIRIVGCKLRQKNRRRNITDALTRGDAEKQGVLFRCKPQILSASVHMQLFLRCLFSFSSDWP